VHQALTHGWRNGSESCPARGSAGLFGAYIPFEFLGFQAEKMSLAEELRTRTELMNREALLPELRPFLQNHRLHHPLIIEYVRPDHAAVVNARYRDLKRQADDSLAVADWSGYIFLHARPYRLEALKKCVGLGLSGSEYWRQVGDVWTDSENIFRNLRRWRKIWCSGEPRREECMDEQERAALADLPDRFRVWRGTSHQRSIKGLSWTTDKGTAEYFARRFAIETQPLLVVGAVPTKDVKAFFLGRGESEVVSVGVRIEKVAPVEPPALPGS
jgi:hypothetical protein